MNLFQPVYIRYIFDQNYQLGQIIHNNTYITQGGYTGGGGVLGDYPLEFKKSKAPN